MATSTLRFMTANSVYVMTEHDGEYRLICYRGTHAGMDQVLTLLEAVQVLATCRKGDQVRIEDSAGRLVFLSSPVQDTMFAATSDSAEV